jgi:hypothetical protein
VADDPSVVRLMPMARSDVGVIEHGSSSLGRWFRQHRLRVAASVALVEGILIVFGPLSWWAAIPIAAVVVAIYWYGGRTSNSYAVRQITWTAAVSQVMVALVPIVFAIVGTLALAVIGILALVVLVALFTERP